MTAKIDIKKNSRIKLTSDGYQAERIAIVTGVSGTAAEVLYNAINDSQLPDIGDVHPDVASITLNNISCEPLGGGQYRVVMQYFKDAGTTTTSSDAEARIVSGLSIEETHEDINGQPLDTTYVLIGGTTSIKQRFTAEVERPRMSIQFEYTATGFPTNDIASYLGKINSTVWNGYPVGSILCSAIDVDQSGANFRVSYSFTYRAEGWRFVGKAANHPSSIDSSSDPGFDLVTSTRTYDVYRSADFTPLGFALTVIGYPLTAGGGAFKVTGVDATLTVA